MRFGALLGMACLVASGRAPAVAVQQLRDTMRLDTITVTATRVPVARSALTSTLTVLQGSELRRAGITTVAGALRGVPGVNVVESGSYGSTTSLFTRGGESDYTKVLIDGVPVNQPGGAFDFAHLSTANIERIEILRGPGSVLYGSDAVTGVVQIFTRRGEGAPRLSGGLRTGTYGSWGLDADLVGSTTGVRYSFGVNHFLSDGAYAFNNDYDNTVVSGRVDIEPDAVTRLALSLRYRDSQFHFPTDASGNLVDHDALNFDEATTVSVEASRFLGAHVELSLLVASNVTTAGTDDAQDDVADTLGFYAFRSLQDLSRQSVDLRSDIYVVPEVIVTLGAQLEQQEERSFNESESQFGPSNGFTDEERSNRAYYAQVLASAGDLTATFGGRVDDDEAFGVFPTFRASIGYLFPSQTQLRGSVARSFKAPTFFENFATGFVTGNPDLDPERSTSWEVGVSQSLARDRATVHANYFFQRFRNLIQFTFDEVPNYRNVAAANASGLEIELSTTLASGVRLIGGFTYLDTDVTDAGLDAGDGATFVEGQRLLRRPTTSWHVGGVVDRWDAVVFGASVDQIGHRDDRDFGTFPATPVKLPAATVANVWANVEVFKIGAAGPRSVATVRIENLFDESYLAIVGFPSRGRTVMVGLRVAS